MPQPPVDTVTATINMGTATVTVVTVTVTVVTVKVRAGLHGTSDRGGDDGP